MQASHKHWLAKFLVGTSALSLMGAAQAAMAQEAPADSSDSVGDEIVVTGIRASLEASRTYLAPAGDRGSPVRRPRKTRSSPGPGDD